MKGLLLAGGHGTRLRPLTFSGNKHMLPIANQPMLFYGLRHLRDAGISQVGIILGPLHEGIEEAVGDGSAFGIRTTYIHQGDPKGLAHAVLCSREFLGDDPFVMYLGDNLLEEGARPIVELFSREPTDAIVGVATVANPSSYGVVELSGERLVSVVEKPATPRSNLALIGVYLFTKSIHPVIEELQPSKRGELEITDAIWRLHEQGGRIKVRQVRGWWKDTGQPNDLLEANELILRSMPPEALKIEGTVEAGAQVLGPVGVGPGSVIQKGAEVVGPTILGSGVQVSQGSRIGPNCAVGNRATVTRSSVQRSIVLDGASLVGVSIANSLVGRNVEITSRAPLAYEITLTIGDSSRVIL